ncbi:hypothetical protein ACOMHN_016286 [Nucella lapillus]
MTSILSDAILLAVAVLLLTNQGGCWKCDVEESVCEVWLDVTHALTMMKEKSLIIVKGGLLFHYNTSKCTRGRAVPMEEVITCDGWSEPKVVIAINGTMPGPLLEVHEGQTVRVHVRNKMLADTTSIHFHGQHQRNTPWMDGVALVNQCPVLPGQTFVHQFTANPAGSYWYHSHVAGQIEMGLVGGFVVHPSEGAEPAYDDQFTLIFQDWNHDWDSDMGFLKMQYGMYVHGHKEDPSRGLSGVRYSAFRIQSVLVNGRGRHRATESSPHNGAPLSTFTVSKGKKYRFRLIHSGNVYPLKVSVDGHRLRVVATDGMELRYPVDTDYVILTPAERYDLELVANQSAGNYWIRAVTLEQLKNRHIGEAILHYNTAEEGTDPTSQDRACTRVQPCVVVNCPFQHFADQDSNHCVNVGDLRNVERMPDYMGKGAKKVKEYFLNFAFPGTTNTPASVNGVKMKLPDVSALTQPLEFSTRCPEEGYRCLEDQLCHCTAVLDLEDGEVAQMVLSDMGVGKGWDHPIHMHGHSFYVLKVGYPKYDNLTGNFASLNEDIDCRGDPKRNLNFCNNATWKNSSWSGNGVPGLELNYPVRKDTINVPTGGYVVIRILADNPGVWPMHCHVALHSEDGMFLLLNESYSNHPPPPDGFPRCGNFLYLT